MNEYSLKRFVFWFGVWVMFALLFGFIAARVFRSPYDQLVKNGVGVEGQITRKEPENHQNVHYSYVVGSQTYSGIGHGGQGGIPKFESLATGQQVQVYYDRDNPALSTLGDPALRLKSANFLTISASLAFSTFATIVILWKTRPHGRRKTT